jgi:hypothetical protein
MRMPKIPSPIPSTMRTVRSILPKLQTIPIWPRSSTPSAPQGTKDNHEQRLEIHLSVSSDDLLKWDLLRLRVLVGCGSGS